MELRWVRGGGQESWGVGWGSVGPGESREAAEPRRAGVLARRERRRGGGGGAWGRRRDCADAGSSPRLGRLWQRPALIPSPGLSRPSSAFSCATRWGEMKW